MEHASDDADDAPDPGPQRRCIVTGAVRNKDGMIRFVVGPDRMIVADIDERLPGRGFWLSADRDTLKKACSKNLFARAARGPVQIPDDFGERVEQLLVRRCIDVLGLARRAGQATIGYEKSRDWLKRGRVGLIVEAVDGAAGGRAKVRAMAANIPVAGVLRSGELGAAAGRERAVHVMVAPGPLAHRLQRDLVRLAGFRPEAFVDGNVETHRNGGF